MIKVLDQAQGASWMLYQADCVPLTAGLPENSIGLSMFSPPYSDQYSYSSSIADMGNSDGDEGFFEHFEYLIPELWRVTIPGRLAVVECKDLPRFKSTSGASGLRDFSGEIRIAFEKHGWVFHDRVTIWRDPVKERAKTNTHGLLHKTFMQDGSATRTGLPVYLMVFRKWTDDLKDTEAPVRNRLEIGDYVGDDAPADEEIYYSSWRGCPPDMPQEQYNYSISAWQNYASPVWMDIDPRETLNAIKAAGDEKHIAPMPLQIARRAIQIWSNEGDVVFSPFAGIGSEGYEALRLHRRFVGVELKGEYFKAAARNLRNAERLFGGQDLFEWAGLSVESVV